MLDSWLWFFAVVYVLSSILIYIVPGFSLLKLLRVRFGILQTVVMSYVLGVCLFGIQGYVFGYLGLRVLTYGYVFAALGLLFFYRNSLQNLAVELVSKLKTVNKIFIFLLLTGVMIQSLQMVGTGLLTAEGMPFYRVHVQDGIFHLSLIQSIIRQFPPMEPGAVGVPVVNYHYWSDLILADHARIFRIPAHMLFFQFTPVVFSLFTGLALIALILVLEIKERRFQKVFMILSLFLLYAGSDLSYLFMLWLHGKWGFYTAAIDNGATQFLNMPHAMAKFLFLSALGVFIVWLRKKKIQIGFLVALIAGVMVGVKIYFGLLFALGLGVVGILIFFEQIKDWVANGSGLVKIAVAIKDNFFLQYAIVVVSFLVLALAIYLPPNKGAGGLAWYPLEWPKLFLADENLDWKDLRYKRAIAEYYKLAPKIVIYDLIMVIVGLLCIHGTRVLGFLPTQRMKQVFGWKLVAFLYGPTLLFTVLGLTTLQQSGGFNVFNFFAASLCVLALMTAFLLTQLVLSRHLGPKLIVAVIIVLTLPRIVYETVKILDSYQNGNDVTVISNDELEALSFISTHTLDVSVIQSHPENRLDSSTPYVSYFANRFTHLSGQKVLETHNQPFKEREQDLRSIFQIPKAEDFARELSLRDIHYIYIKSGEHIPVDSEQKHLRLVFENPAARVYNVVYP